MDVTPPAAAGKPSRRTEPLPAPAQPTGAALVLRRLGTAVAGLAVAALAGGACVLSFDALRALAVSGGARTDLAYLYPAGFDVLLAIALISMLLLRPARLLLRVQAVLILALLVAAAAAANVVIAMGFTVAARQAALGVAVAPWVMLVIGLWLFLLPARRLQSSPSTADVPEPDGRTEAAARTDHDLLPFGREERDPDLAPPLETGHAAALEREYAPHLEIAHASEPEIDPVVPPTPAPETPTVDELPPLHDETRIRNRPKAPTADTPEDTAPEQNYAGVHYTDSARGGRDTERGDVASSERGGTDYERREVGSERGGADYERGEVGSERGATDYERGKAGFERGDVPSEGRGAMAAEEDAVPEQQHAVPEPEPEQRLVPKPRVQATTPSPPQRDPDLPLRWGDLVRPTTGDVLVHPLPKSTSERGGGDTQPYPQVTDRPTGQVRHRQPAEHSSADADVSDDPDGPDTQPYPHLRDNATPLPSDTTETPHSVTPETVPSGTPETVPSGTPEDATAGTLEEAGPDPAHGADVADEEESPRARRQPYREPTTAPPSGRMRSTPLPPED
ncbi:hypothetical protein GCM10022226_77090 [Sphaerisporangium flaviroseum]|uniref:DUF2637 domain-containing protein n=1 Tax=Sphaerisporangium flaviroseum TaxID=509199 RepID=A0ABP7JFN2_9ACTN